jgi:hypothetical protein
VSKFTLDPSLINEGKVGVYSSGATYTILEVLANKNTLAYCKRLNQKGFLYIICEQVPMQLKVFSLLPISKRFDPGNSLQPSLLFAGKSPERCFSIG